MYFEDYTINFLIYDSHNIFVNFFSLFYVFLLMTNRERKDIRCERKDMRYEFYHKKKKKCD
jgi:hypothetical protein